MTRDRWQRVEDVFNAALDLDPEERRAYIETACNGDADLQAEVAALLDCDSHAPAAIANLIQEEICTLPEPAGQSDIGLQLGPYHVTRTLGAGGMGVVYQAVRTDPNYLQVVAIKLIRLGMASEPIQARFRQERQILANLKHPNIAAILDGGTAPDGRPYIVMEYVEGKSIVDYCEEHLLTITERVQLFRDVCAAVQHAHQKLVIHRDIKPGNILVTEDGIPKLLDFGVAKLLIPELVAGSPALTETTQAFMTPDYASPEQVRGEALSTSTDVYSLGIVLYEMLTGDRPYRLTGQAPSEIERVVCREEPRPPSDAPGISNRLRKDLAGDLNNIVLMALRKEPERRYGSVQELSEDLSRFLNGRPVAARKDTFGYRTGKLIQRHRAAVVAAALVILTLTGGMIVTTLYARRAERRFDQVRGLATSMIFETNDSLRDVPGSTAARAKLVANALRYLDGLAKEAGNDSDLLLELSQAYQRIGEVQGSPYFANLGGATESLASYKKALVIADRLYASNPKDSKRSAWLVQILHAVGGMQVQLGDSAGALASYQRALPMAVTLHDSQPGDANAAQLLASSYLRMGEELQRQRHAVEALQQYRGALKTLEEVIQWSPGMERSAGVSYRRIASTLVDAGLLSEALRSYEKSLAVRESLAKREPGNLRARRELAVIHIDLANVLMGAGISKGDSVLAEAHARKALAIAEDLARQDPKNAQGQSDLAFAYNKLGEVKHTSAPTESADFLRVAIAITRSLLNADPNNNELRRWLSNREARLAEALAALGKRTEAIDHLTAANSLLKASVSRDPSQAGSKSDLMSVHCRLCDLHREAGNLDESLGYEQQARILLSQLDSNTSSVFSLLDQGLCYESFAALHRSLAQSVRSDRTQRDRHSKESADWLKKADAIWPEWPKRGLELPAEYRKRLSASR
jgi:tetratricopeptide (TPR) repeat protein